MEEERILEAARVAHEVNRAYCEAIGDGSQKRWADAPRWQRDSAIAGVRSIDRDRTITPEETHQLWLAHKQAEGWTYGPVKDAEAKTHPCMKPYHELPPEQRIKDKIFIAAARSVLGIYEGDWT